MVIRKRSAGTVETRLLIIQCVARIVVLSTLRLLPEYRPYRYHTAGTDYCGPADYCQRQCVYTV